jgi:hypothetical protein
MGKCIFCGKEQPSKIWDNTRGAMFICKNTGSTTCYGLPSQFGLAKRRGCIEYGVIDADNSFNVLSSNSCYCLGMSEADCKEIYNDIPAEGEAWLVKPIKDGWSWTHVDPDIAFWNE